MRFAIKRLFKAVVNVHVRVLVLGIWVISMVGGVVLVPIGFLFFWAACELLDAVGK